jgi:hypothetical protein
MELFLDILDLFKALLFPVELEVDVMGGGRHRQVTVCQFHDLLHDVLIVNTGQLRVHAEVKSDLLVGNLY